MFSLEKCQLATCSTTCWRPAAITKLPLSGTRRKRRTGPDDHGAGWRNSHLPLRIHKGRLTFVNPYYPHFLLSKKYFNYRKNKSIFAFYLLLV